MPFRVSARRAELGALDVPLLAIALRKDATLSGPLTALGYGAIGVTQAGGNAFQWTSGASLQAIVDTITRTGATPDDLMAILQALAEAGALTGDLVVI